MTIETTEPSRRRFLLSCASAPLLFTDNQNGDETPHAKRLPKNPIITPESHPSIGTNINGPSLIRVPRWVERPLGAYYLYFADHKGKTIRLAYADSLRGPWKIHPPGTLTLAQSHFTDHIASPEVKIDSRSQQIRLYYHGLTPEDKTQHTRVALSKNGIDFVAQETPVGLGSAYWRLFEVGGWHYALAMPGKLYRSPDGLRPFEAGRQIFPPSPTQAHNAILIRKGMAHLFYTRAGDAPERILHSQMRLTPDWNQWNPSPPSEFLAPETPWEGADLPLVAGRIGALEGRTRALRDPAVFQEKGKDYLLYAIAGESGIAIAEMVWQ